MPLSPNDTLNNGKYRILRLVGSGGFGHVYLAKDTLLNSDFAIKELIPARAGDKAARDRFLAEASGTMRLTHERIVRTHGVFEDRGNYYIVMEYLAGGSLEDHLRQTPILSPDVARQVAADVAEGLAYAHRQGVVHCDVKPANILFTADGRAKIGDFGIAHVTGETHTQTWQGSRPFIAGTLPYMSPEQINGIRTEPRSDVYALGAVLYRMLTGRPYLPFSDEETPGAQADNVILVRNEPVEPPSKFNPAVPPTLDRAVLRALSKRAADRFATATEMQVAVLPGDPPNAPRRPVDRDATVVLPPPPDDATRVQHAPADDGTRVQRVPPSPPVRPRRISGKEKLAVALSAGLVGLLALVAALWLIGGPPQPGEMLPALTETVIALTVPAGGGATAAAAPTATPTPTATPVTPTVAPPLPTQTRPPTATSTPSPSPTFTPTTTPTPTFTPTATQLPTRKPGSPLSTPYTVEAAQGWHDTWIAVNQNDLVRVEYLSGQWKAKPGLAETTGQGHTQEPLDGDGSCGLAPVADAARGALIARIGDGPAFLTGDELSFAADRTGLLRLSINEAQACISDNAGALTVQVSIKAPGPATGGNWRGASVSSDGIAPHNVLRLKGSEVSRTSHTVESIAISPDGVVYALGSLHSLTVFDTGGEPRSLAGHDGQTHSAEFCPDGATLYTGGVDEGGGRLRVWDTATGTELWSQVIGPQGWGVLAALSPDCRWVATNAGGKAVLWQMGVRELVKPVELASSFGTPVFSPEGKWLAYFAGDRRTTLRPLEGGPERQLDWRGPAVMAFAPDGSLLAVGSETGEVGVFRIADSKLVRTLKAQNGIVHGLRFSPSGQIIATAGWRGDGTVRLWRVADGRLLHTLPSQGEGVWTLTFTPENDGLLAAYERSLQGWGVEPEPSR